MSFDKYGSNIVQEYARICFNAQFSALVQPFVENRVGDGSSCLLVEFANHPFANYVVHQVCVFKIHLASLRLSSVLLCIRRL